jgi:hypothetical protein
MKHLLISWLILIIPFIGMVYKKKPVKIERVYETFQITDK